MWNNMIQVAAATAGFAVIHSALASLMAKRTAARMLGERNRNGLYRVFFITQSVVLFGLLTEFILSLPNQELYRVESPLIWLMYGAQAVAVLYTIAATRQIGIVRILGLKSLVCWFGRGPVPPEPEAQGPAIDSAGLARKAGPFAWSRHPLNFAPLIILWPWPTMSTNLLAFNASATIYVLVGSLHEEVRLRTAYGEPYAAYQRSGVPYYFPWPSRSAFRPMRTILQSEESKQ